MKREVYALKSGFKPRFYLLEEGFLSSDDCRMFYLIKS